MSWRAPSSPSLSLILSPCMWFSCYYTLYNYSVHKATFYFFVFSLGLFRKCILISHNKQATERELIQIAVDESMHYAPDSPVAPPYSPLTPEAKPV